MIPEILKDILVGFVPTVLAWFFFFVLLAPKIGFSSRIKKQPNSDHVQETSNYSFRYKVGIRNESFNAFGLFKNDLNTLVVSARIIWSEKTEDSDKGRKIFANIPIEYSEFKYEIPLLERNNNTKLMRWVDLAYKDLSVHQAFPSWVKEILKRPDYLLEDLMDSDTQLWIFVQAHGSLSGHVKHFVKKFTKSEIT